MYNHWHLYTILCTQKKEKNFNKKQLLKDIEEIDNKLGADSHNSELLEEKEFLQLALNDILNVETQGLIIRSRIKWAEEGEKSSRYFCNLEKRTGEKKSIFRLKNENDDVIVNQQTILGDISLFYQNLYRKQCDGNNNICTFF